MYNAGRALMNRGKDPVSSKIITDAKERLKLLRKYHSNPAQKDRLARVRKNDAATGNISGRRVVEEAKNLGRRSIPELTNYIGEKINPIDWISAKIRARRSGISLKKRRRDSRIRDEVNKLAVGAAISAGKDEIYSHTD